MMRKLVKFAAACAAVVCASGAWAEQTENEVPAKFVEYIESSGSEYIDLGEVLTPTTVATVDYEVTAKNGNFNIFGRRNWFAFITHDWIYTRGKRIVTSAYQGTGQRNVVTIDADAQTIVANGSNLSLVSWSGSEGESASSPGYLFWSHGSAEGKAKMKLYSCVISNDDQLAVALYPCVDKNGVAGLYDAVSKTIFRNASGTGAFTASETESPLPPDYATNALLVSGSPDTHAADNVSPAYGYHPLLVGGESVTVSAPSAWTNATGTLKVKCLGYKRYAYDAANGAWQYLDASADTSFALSVIDGPSVKIEWQWQVQRDAIILRPGDDIVAAATAAAAGDVLELAEGTYDITAELNLTAAVTIRGAGMDKTIIRQTTANQHVAVLDDAGACIEGCTLTGAHFTEEKRSGVGVYIKSNGGILRDCRITGNDSTRNHNRGVGIYCVSANARVERCVIDNNKITGNTNACYAGGVQANGGVFSHCLIVNNKGHNAGGVYVDGPATFEWCTIADNTVNNDTTGGYGGVRIAAAGATFANCIIAGNHSGSTDVSVGAPDWGGTQSVTFDHTALATGVGVNSYIKGTPLVCDVLFEDLAGGNYRQRLASDARDLGYYAPFDTDVFACDFKVSPASLFAGETVSLTSFIAGCDAAGTTYAWTVTKPDGTTDRLEGANPSYVPQQIGAYSVGLEVSADGETTDYALPDCFFAALVSATVTTGPELEQAVAESVHGSVITCAPGDYALDGTLKLGKGIRLIGSGWDNCTLRQTKKGVRTLFLDDADDFVEGFTVTGGQNTNEGEHGRGVYIGVRGGTLSKCRVIGNVGTRNWTHGMGVAMVGDGLVTHCVISNNTLSSGYYNTFGGGIYASMGMIDNCLVADNANVSSSESRGGGIYAVGSVKVRNCTVVRNESRETGGGVFAKNGAERFVNCLIAGNKTSSSDTTTGRPEWGAGTGKDLFDHCLLPVGVTTNATTGGTCVVADPVFVDADAGDFREQTSSPSKDAGIAYEGLADVDLDGAVRVSGKGVDIGCYEFDSSAFTVAFTGPAGMNGFTGVQATFTASVSGLDDSDVPDYAWTVVTPSGRELSGSGATLTVDADEPGNWQISVTASFGGRTSPASGETYYAVPRELYVKVATAEAAAASRFPYGTWATAATNVLDAIEAAIPGCTIFLDEGEHRVEKTVSLEKGITMIGAGREKTALRQTSKTTSVLYLNHENALVRGMTITGLDATSEIHSRGAVIIDARGGTVEDCRITGNKYGNNINQACGIGITLNGEKAVCRRCIIDRNKGSNGVNNDRGGGVHGVKGLLESCLVCFNTNKYAGGISIGSGNYTASNFKIRNCTVYGNVGTDTDSALYGQYGVGGIGQFSGNATIENTIIFGNSSPNQSWTTGGYPEWRTNGGTLTFVNCLLPEGIDWPTSAADCLNGDPLFKDVAAGDFRITAASPAVNAGSRLDYMADSTDLGGNPRISRRIVDIGCYEYSSTGLFLIVK